MLNTIIFGDSCNFNCTYCFEKKKHNKYTIKYEYIEKYLTTIYSDENPYNQTKDEEQVISFIAGEPLLYMDLIIKTTELYLSLIEKYGLRKPAICIATNGYLLDTPKVQEYLNKYKEYISLECSIDGNKKGHDKNRVLKDGSGTYDKVMYNILNYIPCEVMLRWTLNSNNIFEYAQSLKEWFNHGFTFRTHLNSEDTDWDNFGCEIYYKQVKELAEWYSSQPPEWVLKHKRLFELTDYKPQFVESVIPTIKCSGQRCTLDCDGTIIKCIYCSKTTTERGNYFVYGNTGDIEHVDWKKAQTDLYYTDMHEKDFTKQLENKCFRCPIGSYCYLCPILYNQEIEFNMCNIFALRHMEKVFFTNYWISVYKQHSQNIDMRLLNGIEIYDGDMKKSDLLLPKCWALELISEEDYNRLAELTQSVGGTVNTIDTKYFTKEQVKAITEQLSIVQQENGYKAKKIIFEEV